MWAWLLRLGPFVLARLAAVRPLSRGELDRTLRDLARRARAWGEAAAAADRHIPGVGLGLTIVKRIVEAHGGRIRAAANEAAGRGTIIHVELPRVPLPALRRPAGLDAGEPPPFVVRRGGSGG